MSLYGPGLFTKSDAANSGPEQQGSVRKLGEIANEVVEEVRNSSLRNLQNPAQHIEVPPPPEQLSVGYFGSIPRPRMMHFDYANIGGLADDQGLEARMPREESPKARRGLPMSVHLEHKRGKKLVQVEHVTSSEEIQAGPVPTSSSAEPQIQEEPVAVDVAGVEITPQNPNEEEDDDIVFIKEVEAQPNQVETPPVAMPVNSDNVVAAPTSTSTVESTSKEIEYITLSDDSDDEADAPLPPPPARENKPSFLLDSIPAQVDVPVAPQAQEVETTLSSPASKTIILSDDEEDTSNSSQRVEDDDVEEVVPAPVTPEAPTSCAPVQEAAKTVVVSSATIILSPAAPEEQQAPPTLKSGSKTWDLDLEDISDEELEEITLKDVSTAPGESIATTSQTVPEDKDVSTSSDSSDAASSLVISTPTSASKDKENTPKVPKVSQNSTKVPEDDNGVMSSKIALTSSTEVSAPKAITPTPDDPEEEEDIPLESEDSESQMNPRQTREDEEDPPTTSIPVLLVDPAPEDEDNDTEGEPAAKKAKIREDAAGNSEKTSENSLDNTEEPVSKKPKVSNEESARKTAAPSLRGNSLSSEEVVNDQTPKSNCSAPPQNSQLDQDASKTKTRRGHVKGTIPVTRRSDRIKNPPSFLAVGITNGESSSASSSVPKSSSRSKTPTKESEDKNDSHVAPPRSPFEIEKKTDEDKPLGARRNMKRCGTPWVRKATVEEDEDDENIQAGPSNEIPKKTRKTRTKGVAEPSRQSQRVNKVAEEVSKVKEQPKEKVGIPARTIKIPIGIEREPHRFPEDKTDRTKVQLQIDMVPEFLEEPTLKKKKEKTGRFAHAEIKIGKDHQAELPAFEEQSEEYRESESNEEILWKAPLPDEIVGDPDAFYEKLHNELYRAIFRQFESHIPYETVLQNFMWNNYEFETTLETIDKSLETLPQKFKPMTMLQMSQFAPLFKSAQKDDENEKCRGQDSVMGRRLIQEKAMRNYHLGEIGNFISLFRKHHDQVGVPCNCNAPLCADLKFEPRWACSRCTKNIRKSPNPSKKCLICITYEKFTNKPRPCNQVILDDEELRIAKKWAEKEEEVEHFIGRDDFTEILIKERNERWERMELTDEEQDIINSYRNSKKKGEGDNEKNKRIVEFLTPYIFPHFSKCQCTKPATFDQIARQRDRRVPTFPKLSSIHEDEYLKVIQKQKSNVGEILKELRMSEETFSQFYKMYANGSGKLGEALKEHLPNYTFEEPKLHPPPINVAPPIPDFRGKRDDAAYEPPAPKRRGAKRKAT